MRFPVLTGAVRRGSPGAVAAAMMLGASLAAGCSNDNDTTGTQAATSIVIVSGNSQSGVVATSASSPFVVQVNDQNGSPVSGVMVTFTATGGATLGSSSATTDGSGRASTTVMFGNLAGADTVTATAAGVGTPAIFAVTANSGAAASLVVMSGNNQTGTVGSPLTNALVVEVVDQFGNAVSGANVDWTTTGGVFAGTPQSVSSADGTASAALQLPSTAGTVTATATVRGTGVSTTFTETAM